MPTNSILLEKNVPAELKELKQWLLWKKNKIPVTIDDSPASTTNEACWSTFSEAINEFVNSSKHRGILGVGFVFAESGGVVGIDLDDAIDGEGLKPWAVKVLSLFNTGYIEYSPSKKGFHILVLGKKPGPKCKRIIQTKNGERLGEIEMYETARYFTMTGELYQARFNKLVDGQSQIDFLYKNVFGGGADEGKKEDSPGVSQAVQTSVLLADLPSLYSIIRGSAQAEKFKRLTEGDIDTALSYYGGDHSRGVYALVSIVAFYTSDFTLMDCIMQGSPLHSAKWIEGKWERLGYSHFKRLRSEYELKKNFYDPERGRISPSEEFSNAEVEEAKSKGEAEYERHVELLWLDHTEARRDLLSGSLFLKHKSGKWTGAFNRETLSAIRGECQVRGRLYKKAKLEDYISRYGSALEPRLLLDVPTWDGVDRIGEMCQRIKLRDVKSGVFEDLFKDWCAKMWGRIFNPRKVQNRCIILSGAQGIGKDIWVKSLFCGLGKYLTDLTLGGHNSKETDISIVMGSSLVMFISEFTKTEALGVDTLKDLITKESFDFVRKYDRDNSTLINRCSIIGACNPEHVLRDVTGNRRFMVFKLDGGPGQAIKWDYPFVDEAFSMNVVSQCKAMWEGGVSACDEAERVIAGITAKYTPEDTNSELVLDFESMVEGRIGNDPLETHAQDRLFRVETLGMEFDTLGRNYGLNRRLVLGILKGAGCQWRNATTRYYGAREVINQILEGELSGTSVIEGRWGLSLEEKKKIFGEE